ncbi:MAG: acyl carrier protein [Candidatus Eremiobacteraeota bacterium]|nr:acyl carrier protein [Candidatus Eremiobacteraeota bacterium]
MSVERLYQRLTTLLRRSFGDDSIVATPELRFLELPHWRAMNYMRLLMSVEEEFDVDIIPELEGTGYMTFVGDLARLITSKTAD